MGRLYLDRTTSIATKALVRSERSELECDEDVVVGKRREGELSVDEEDSLPSTRAVARAAMYAIG